MALIGTIRKRSGLLIFLIGLSIVGFLVMDMTNSQGSVLKGRKDSVGKVNGEKIAYTDFNKKYEDNLKNAEDQMRSQGQSIGDDQRNYIRTQTWTEVVNELIFKNVYENLGINVTNEEMSELATGQNVSPSIANVPIFKSQQTGQFDPANVRLYLTQLDRDDEGEEPGSKRKRWNAFEKQLKQGQYQQKYNNLITKGLYVPTWMAEMTYNDQSRLVDFKYVLLPFVDVKDADVKISDDDIKTYVAAHAAKYKVEDETRKFSFVAFDIAPSSGDSARTIQSLEEKRAEFAKGEKASDDSLFVKLYSETPFDEVYYDKDKLTSPVKDSFFAQPVKSIVGPYIDGKFVKLAKISDRKMISDSVRVREIAFSFAGMKQDDPSVAAKFKLIDSIQKAVDSLHADFGALAAQFSDDPMGKMKAGDIGWVKQGEKETYYNNVIFYRAVKGKTYRTFSGNDRINLIQVIEDKPSKAAVQISYLTKEIIPSPETERAIYGNATTFASENQAEAKFREAGKKLNAKTIESIKKDEFQVQGLGSSRELIKWVFNGKKGDVSSIFTVDKKHVVALVEQVRAAGLPDVDAVREQVKPEVLREKKFELLSKKVTDAKANNVDELASKLGKPAIDATHISFASPALGVGYEPKVVGAAFATAKGKLSAPVKGNEGVYVVQTVAVQEPAKQTDYSVYSFQMNQQLQGKARYASEVQKKLAKVVDDRFDFF